MYTANTSGAHRALAFPDFLGLLIGLGLEAYRKQYRLGDGPEEEPEGEGGEAALHLFDINPAGLPDLFREFDEAVKTPEETPALRLVHTKELSS
jgi:hypothetical protein